MPARTSPTLPPPSPRTVSNYPVSKCPSASIVATSTLRVKENSMQMSAKLRPSKVALLKANEESGFCIQGWTLSTNSCSLSLLLDGYALVTYNGLSLDKGSIEAGKFWQGSIDFHKFQSNKAMFSFNISHIPSTRQDGWCSIQLTVTYF